MKIGCDACSYFIAEYDIGHYCDYLYSQYKVKMNSHFINSPIRRRADFLVGRVLANEAMSSIGIDKSEVHTGSYGEPVWPNGVVGSLSHDNGLVCCLVARKKAFSLIGIDIQCRPDEEFLEHSIDRLVSEFEWRILNNISTDRRWLLTLIFSAKETFYKAVFPIIRKVLDFREAQLISVDLDRNSLLIQASEMVDNPNLGFLRLEIKYKEIRQGTFLTYTVSNFNQRSGVLC